VCCASFGTPTIVVVGDGEVMNFMCKLENQALHMCVPEVIPEEFPYEQHFDHKFTAKKPKTTHLMNPRNGNLLVSACVCVFECENELLIEPKLLFRSEVGRKKVMRIPRSMSN